MFFLLTVIWGFKWIYECNSTLVPGRAENPGMDSIEADTGSEPLLCAHRMKQETGYCQQPVVSLHHW